MARTVAKIIYGDVLPERARAEASLMVAEARSDGGVRGSMLTTCFNAILGLVKQALSPKLRETAYALAVDVATVDRTLKPEEARILQGHLRRKRRGPGRGGF